MGQAIILSQWPATGSGGSGPLTIVFTGSTWSISVAYTGYLQASGGAGGYTYSISSGSLPGWATLNTSTGAITGTPNATGITTFTGKVTDSASATATINCTLTIISSGGGGGTASNVTGFTAVPNYYPTVPVAANGGQQWDITIQASATPPAGNFLQGQLVLKPAVGALSASITSGSTSLTVNNIGVPTSVANGDYIQVDTEIMQVGVVTYPTAFTESYTLTSRGLYTAEGFSVAASHTVTGLGTPGQGPGVFNLSSNGRDFVSGLPVIPQGVTTAITGSIWPMGYPTWFIAYCVSVNALFQLNAYPIPPTGGATPLTPQVAPFLVAAVTTGTVGAETPNLTAFTASINAYPNTPLTVNGLEQWSLTINGTPPVNSTTGQVDSRFTDAQSILKPAVSALSAPITVTTSPTTITLASSWPTTNAWIGGYTKIANNDYIQIDSEIMQVSSGGGTTSLVVTRGQKGTTAATHAINVSPFGAVFDLTNPQYDVWSGPPRILAAGPNSVTGPLWPMGYAMPYICYCVAQDDGVQNTYPVWNVTPQTTPFVVSAQTAGLMKLTTADPTTLGPGMGGGGGGVLTATQAGTNLLNNPGFEVGPIATVSLPTLYTGYAAGWYFQDIRYADINTAAGFGIASVHSGSYCLGINTNLINMQVTNCDTSKPVNYRYISVAAGQYVSFSAWMMKTGSAVTNIVLCWFDQNYADVTNTWFNPTLTSSWSLATTGQVLVPTGAYFCVPMFYVAAASVGSWYIDDVSCQISVGSAQLSPQAVQNINIAAGAVQAFNTDIAAISAATGALAAASINSSGQFYGGVVPQYTTMSVGQLTGGSALFGSVVAGSLTVAMNIITGGSISSVQGSTFVGINSNYVNYNNQQSYNAFVASNTNTGATTVLDDGYLLTFGNAYWGSTYAAYSFEAGFLASAPLWPLSLLMQAVQYATNATLGSFGVQFSNQQVVQLIMTAGGAIASLTTGGSPNTSSYLELLGASTNYVALGISSIAPAAVPGIMYFDGTHLYFCKSSGVFTIVT